jgi:hypothetical protein
MDTLDGDQMCFCLYHKHNLLNIHMVHSPTNSLFIKLGKV